MASNSNDMWALVKYKDGGDTEIVHIRDIYVDTQQVVKEGQEPQLKRKSFTPPNISHSSFDKDFWYTVKTSLRQEDGRKRSAFAVIGRLGCKYWRG